MNEVCDFILRSKLADIDRNMIKEIFSIPDDDPSLKLYDAILSNVEECKDFEDDFTSLFVRCNNKPDFLPQIIRLSNAAIKYFILYEYYSYYIYSYVSKNSFSTIEDFRIYLIVREKLFEEADSQQKGEKFCDILSKFAKIYNMNQRTESFTLHSLNESFVIKDVIKIINDKNIFAATRDNRFANFDYITMSLSEGIDIRDKIDEYHAKYKDKTTQIVSPGIMMILMKMYPRNNILTISDAFKQGYKLFTGRVPDEEVINDAVLRSVFNHASFTGSGIARVVAFIDGIFKSGMLK